MSCENAKLNLRRFISLAPSQAMKARYLKHSGLFIAATYTSFSRRKLIPTLAQNSCFGCSERQS